MIKEAQILSECCQYLKDQGFFFWRVNNIPVYGRALPKWVPRGLPDIMIVCNGKFLAVECKRPEGGKDEREKNGRAVRGGKLSPFQAEWATKLVLAGGEYATVNSLPALITALKYFKFL